MSVSPVTGASNAVNIIQQQQAEQARLDAEKKAQDAAQAAESTTPEETPIQGSTDTTTATSGTPETGSPAFSEFDDARAAEMMATVLHNPETPTGETSTANAEGAETPAQETAEGTPDTEANTETNETPEGEAAPETPTVDPATETDPVEAGETSVLGVETGTTLAAAVTGATETIDAIENGNPLALAEGDDDEGPPGLALGRGERGNQNEEAPIVEPPIQQVQEQVIAEQSAQVQEQVEVHQAEFVEKTEQVEALVQETEIVITEAETKLAEADIEIQESEVAMTQADEALDRKDALEANIGHDIDPNSAEGQEIQAKEDQASEQTAEADIAQANFGAAQTELKLTTLDLTITQEQQNRSEQHAADAKQHFQIRSSLMQGNANPFALAGI